MVAYALTKSMIYFLPLAMNKDIVDRATFWRSKLGPDVNIYCVSKNLNTLFSL